VGSLQVVEVGPEAREVRAHTVAGERREDLRILLLGGSKMQGVWPSALWAGMRDDRWVWMVVDLVVREQ